jgi:hypothetical protein
VAFSRHRLALPEAAELIGRWTGWPRPRVLLALEDFLRDGKVPSSERRPGEERRLIDPLRFTDAVLPQRAMGRSLEEWTFYDADDVGRPAFPKLRIDEAALKVAVERLSEPTRKPTEAPPASEATSDPSTSQGSPETLPVTQEDPIIAFFQAHIGARGEDIKAAHKKFRLKYEILRPIRTAAIRGMRNHKGGRPPKNPA